MHVTELEMWLSSLQNTLNANTTTALTTNVQGELDWLMGPLDTPRGPMSAGACWIKKESACIVLFKKFMFCGFTNFTK